MFSSRLASLPPVVLGLAVGVLAVGLAVRPAHGQRGAALSGTVTSTEASQPIVEAAITLFSAGSDSALTGTATDRAGRYRLAGIAPGSYWVAVRAPGYRAAQRRVVLEAGQSETLDLALHTATSGAAAIVTTPAHRPESVRHASTPAFVVDEAALHQSTVLSPLDGLRAVPGVHLALTGLGQRQLSLPNAGGVSLRGPLVLVDGRRAGLPGPGSAVMSLLPAPAIDLNRVEVLQSGAAVVHGPMARSGVIHAITKNPFDNPGTAIAVAGGTPMFTQGQFRHAAVIGSTFGYEIVTYGAQGTNWPFARRAAQRLMSPAVLDPSAPVLPNQRVDPATGRLRRDDGYWTAGIHGEAAYRVGAQTTVTARGGYTALTGPLYATWGPLQADPLGYAFAQLRLESGGVQAHVGLNNTQTGTSYWYGTGQAITNRDVAYDAQLHYRIDKPYWGTALTVGADGYWVRPRTDHSLMGQHEERDALDRYGAFGAARTTLSPWLTLSYAARADADSRSAALWPAVQVAALADVAANHTVRLQYERSASALGAHGLFLDTDVYSQSLGGAYRLVYRARGAADGFSFDQYRRSGQATSLLPGEASFGAPLALSSIPLRPLYDAALARLTMAWGDPAERPAPVQQLTADQRQQFVAALGELTDALDPDNQTAGVLGRPDGQGYRSVGSPRDVPPLQRPIAQAVSVGYHGVMGRHVEVTADAYAGTTKNAIRPQMASALVFAPQVRADLEPVLAPLITQSASNPDAPVGRLIDAMGMTPDEAAAFTAQAMESAYDGVPVGVVMPDQAVGGSSTEQGALLTYRNIGRVYQTGAHLGARVTLRDHLRINGAVTVRHLTHWRRSAADGSPSSLLGAPPAEAHVGVEWMRGAWTAHATVHYAAAHSMRVGWYAGTVEAAYPVDVGLRFDAQRYIPGLSAQLAVQNVLNQRHHGLVEAPATGRLAWVRLTYAL